MNYKTAQSIVQSHINRAVRVVLDTEVDLDRPSKFRTEHILILMEITKKNICDALFACQYQEDYRMVQEKDEAEEVTE